MVHRWVIPAGLALLGWSCAAGHGSSGGPAQPPEPVAVHVPLAGQQSVQVDFASEILPILEAGCTPCHFDGGKMHAALPFDRPETVTLLGERLLTRIDEPDQQALIRRFLAQEASTEARGAGAEP